MESKSADDLRTRLARLRGVVEGLRGRLIERRVADQEYWSRFEHEMASIHLPRLLSLAESRLAEAERYIERAEEYEVDWFYRRECAKDLLSELERCLLPEEPTTSARG